ncbi:MAG: DNA/RNA non-specific endonuclease [Muribaculaceae bacterium]|nr:DNA/RNA non-specific endonuclease [Muribaculaceae bacterium]
MKRLPKWAMFGLIFSFILIGTGCMLAINSCSKNDDPENPGNQKPSESAVDLYTVTLPWGTPEQIKEYTGFTVSFNKDNHTPNYVAWELLDSEVSYDVDRSDNFWQDLEIEGCPAHADYTHSGYDRGHMCPAADQKWSVEAMNDCFVMANMCPQAHELNAGAWEALENKTRQWAKRDKAVWVIAGPIYDENDTKRIGLYNIHPRVPGNFFKVLLALEVEEPRAIAFVFPNMASPGNMMEYAMSVDDLEEMLGYDFFSVLPDDIENKVEAKRSFAEWNR